MAPHMTSPGGARQARQAWSPRSNMRRGRPADGWCTRGGPHERLQEAWAQMDRIIIKGAREHNLKNIDLEIPPDQLVVITGLSRSGKSSLPFHTNYAQGH